METSRKTVLRVEGMTCPSCIHHVQTALKGLEGVRGVDVRLREGKVSVESQGDQPPLAAMIEALREAGYESSPDPQA